MTRPFRLALRTPVLLLGHPYAVGVTLDLSRGGIGFLAPRAYAEGEALEIEVFLRDRPKGVRMVVEVAWCLAVPGRRLAHRCGARLLAIGVRESMILRDLMATEPQANAA